MILIHDSQQRAALLEQYRQLARLDKATLSAADQRLMATADNTAFPGAVLPGPTPECPEARRLYAIADCGAQWRQLAPLLRACVGVTITDFVGRTTTPDPSSALEMWLADSGLYVARLTAGTGIDGTAPSGLIRLLARMIDRSEAPGRGVPRSNDEVLDALAMALAAGRCDAALAEIEFLRQNWRVDALNLRFLEVRVDAELRDWHTLRARPFFDDLCRTRRPVPVTAALLEAIYHISIGPAEHDVGAAATLDLFRRTVHGRVGTLLDVPPANPTRPVATLFALAALAGDLPDRQAITLLDETALAWDEEDRQAYRALVDVLLSEGLARPGMATADPDAAAMTDASLDDTTETVYGDGPRTFSWAATLVELRALQDDSEAATIERARSAILGAVELNGFEASRLALAYVDRLIEQDRAQLFEGRVIASHWEALQRLAAEGQVPVNWLEWIALMPAVSAETARAWAERGVVEWPIGEHLRSAHDAATLGGAFERVGSGADALLASRLERRRDAALADLFRWLQRDPSWPNPEYLELYGRVLYLLALSPNRSPAMLEVLTELLRGMLQVGLTASVYEDTMSILVDVMRDLDSASFIDSLIDMVEVTAEAACPSAVARYELWGLVLGLLAQHGTHLTFDHRTVLRELASLLGMRHELEAALPGESEIAEPALLDLAGYRIGVYTLMENVGNRVKLSLERNIPGVLVEVNTSTVATDSLMNLARRSDLFVLGWRAAKHAATDAITAARPSTSPTIFPAGKGSSSVLAAVRSFLLDRELAADPTR